MPDSRLAATMGAECARMIHASLARIETAISQGGKKATLTVKVVFSVGKSGVIEATLQPTEAIPMDSTTLKLAYRGNQLELFEGESVD